MNNLQLQTKARLDFVSKRKSLNNKELSHLVDRSRSVVSEIRNGRRQFSDLVLNQIKNRLSAYQPDDGLLQTSQYNVLTRVCTGCLHDLDLRMVIGDTGLGKTMVLKDFSANNEHAYYLKIGQSMTQTMFLKQVALAVGCKVEQYRRDHFFERISERLDEKGSMVLLIDECEVLSLSTLKVIKHLHNAFEGSLGIVVVGVPSLKSRLMKQGGIAATTFQLIKPSNEYTTLFRRCKFFHLGGILQSDSKLFSDRQGITNPKVISYLFNRCWNYDYLDKLLAKALRMGVDFDQVLVEDLDKITIY